MVADLKRKINLDYLDGLGIITGTLKRERRKVPQRNVMITEQEAGGIVCMR
jgi:hypothetical protein